jgi:pimeloyl-ACP methyl ester carboxylesterase
MDLGGIVHERLGRGEPLLLLHGLGHRRQAWDPVVRALAERYEVFALDLPGFGQSAAPDPDRPFDISSLVDTVQGWCETHGVRRPHVVGNSLGGAVALELGARGLASSVTALAPIGFTSGLEMLASRLLVGGMHLATRIPSKVWGAVIDSRPVRALTTLALHGRLRAPGGGLSRLDPAVVTRGSTYTRLAPEVVRYSFGGGRGVVCPTTIAWGEDDRVLPIRALARVLTAIPHARQVRLMRCGHVPMENDPATVVEVILRTCRTAAGTVVPDPAPAA